MFSIDEEGELDLGLGKLISRRTLLAAAKRYQLMLKKCSYLIQTCCSRGKLLRGKGSNSKLASGSYSASGMQPEAKKAAEVKPSKSPTSSAADFAEFLNTLKKPAAKDIVDQLQAYV